MSSIRSLIRPLLAVSALVACSDDPSPPTGPSFEESAIAASMAASTSLVAEIEREQVVGDVHHYSLLLTVGDGPSDRIRIHRMVREQSPWQARPTVGDVMLLHGDFSTFESNFAPGLVGTAAAPEHGLAVHLAQQGIDVWGFDRRWTTTPLETTDFTGFEDMTMAAEVDDTERALLFARTFRGLTSAGWDRMVLAGFSRGAQLTYMTASEESQRPQWQRNVRAIAPIDAYAVIAPEDEETRLGACGRAADQYAAVAAGITAGDNTFFSFVADLAVTAPDDPSPIFEGFTNRQTMLFTTGQTFAFFPATPVYHLNAIELDDAGLPASLLYTDEGIVADWFAAAPPWQSVIESADGDALWCGDEPLPMELHLEDVTVPLYYLGAAGGFGDHGLYTTTLVGSTDVTVNVIRLLDPADEIEDYGHADLLHAADSPALAWQPLADWIVAH